MSRVPEGYTDCWTPIESNPEIFTELAWNLGMSKSLKFLDIWALDPDSVAILPRPVHALVLVFPTDGSYEQNRMAREVYHRWTSAGKVIWFSQTIYNACGLYGYPIFASRVTLLIFCLQYISLLHAVCNGEARNQICKCEHQPGVPSKSHYAHTESA